ncbi:hypothetical protein [Saccharopolyspora sp. 5N708]|uniref:hypothetical protein n=1 Tax=Saccharopolyspora sp. 5N708 TaxID=3457424 RepID=UPI003FD02645
MADEQRRTGIIASGLKITRTGDLSDEFADGWLTSAVLDDPGSFELPECEAQAAPS